MGLDQYLTARRYIGGWDHCSPEEKQQYSQITKAVRKPDFKCPESPSLYVELTVAYWRKANQIHRWFVQNVQGGADDCNKYSVEVQELEELRDLCELVLGGSELVDGIVQNGTSFSPGEPPVRNFEDGKIIRDPTLAVELLPISEGFFFGGTDYDEWYYRQLQDTVSQINKAILHFGPEEQGHWWHFEYQSSW